MADIQKSTPPPAPKVTERLSYSKGKRKVQGVGKDGVRAAFILALLASIPELVWIAVTAFIAIGSFLLSAP